jgi:hypothetical protein
MVPFDPNSVPDLLTSEAVPDLVVGRLLRGRLVAWGLLAWHE